MNSPSCEKEQRVLECLLGGSWPGPAGESLPEHTVTCPVCSDLVLAVEHLREESRRAVTAAALPEAGLVWWKAQLRLKRDAADRATQPIAMVERLALACASLSSAGVVFWKWPEISAWVNRLGDIASRASFGWTPRFNLLVLSACGAFLVLMVFALYFDWADQ